MIFLFDIDSVVIVATSASKKAKARASSLATSTKMALIEDSIANALKNIDVESHKRKRDSDDLSGALSYSSNKRPHLEEGYASFDIAKESNVDMIALLHESSSVDSSLLVQDPHNQTKAGSTPSPSIDIMISTSTSSLQRLYQELGLTPLSLESLLSAAQVQLIPSGFDNFVHSVVQSSSVASLMPLQPSTFSRDHLYILFQRL